MWPTSTPWVLETYDAKEVTEGGVTARTEYCFEKDPETQFPTGFLLRMRAVASGTTPGVRDTLVVYSHDAAGNVTSEQYFGGDTQTVGTVPLCSLALPSSSAYRIDHTYQYGSRATSRYVDSSGNSLPFKILDRDIDANTGLTSRRRDTAEVVTTFDYDGMGRLTWEKPQISPDGGAWNQYLYTPASGSNPAKVNLYRYLNNTGTVLAQQEYLYDPFGRLTNERQLLADGTWSERLTTYDGTGRRSRVSEWRGLGQALHETVYSDFDVFGRAQTITPPDGAAHQTTIAYTGTRQVQRTVKVATSRVGTIVNETPVTTTEIYDRQGRLYQVVEPKPGGGTVTTAYGYDVGGRLASVLMRDDVTSQTQSRTFTYDNRGFLTAQTLPEKGTSGNGTVTYPSYDARGHLRQAIDGTHDLTFEYDPAERLTDVRVTGSPSALKTFTFANANGTTPDGTTDFVKGKLQTTSRTNADGTVVGEWYYYGGVGGRVSHRDTTWPGQSARLKVSWTDLGDVASLTYPQIPGVGPARTVCYPYSNGFFVGVTDVGAGTCPGGASLASLSYHPNGMTWQVSHGNLVTDTYDKDPNDMGRPYRISSANALANWNSGTFEYDGAGNVKALRGMSEPVARPAPTAQLYTYDTFANLTRITLNDTTYQDLATSASSNRLTASGYDASGNLTAWGGYAHTYDPLNAMTTLTGGTLNKAYAYDAGGERMSFKDVPSSTSVFTLRGLDGKVLREYSYNGSSWSWSKDVVYRQGQLLATIDGSGTRHFTLDHLGSPRLITDASRNVVEYHAYWGYGQEIDTACGAERMKFTGHERDNRCTAGMLDYMHARYYNPNIARFLSVDVAPGLRAAPQSWNGYSYADTNPARVIDPNGLYGIDFHYDVTYYLAVLAGKGRGDAEQLASADRSVDREHGASPLRPSDFHRHFMAREEAEAVVGSAVGNAALGSALHSLQDSFSHEGFGWPLGHVFENAIGQSPDDPWRNVLAAIEAAKATFQALGGDPAKLDMVFLHVLFSVHSPLERTRMAQEAANRALSGPRGQIAIHVDPANATTIANYYVSQGFTVYIDGVPYHGPGR
jgi:RHS repeat-associated protein